MFFSKEKLEKITYIVTIFGFPILFASMLFGFDQIQDLKKAVSSQNNIALNTEFFNASNTGIIDAIENNRPILISNKGIYTPPQLDNYLGDFDTIDTAYQEELLTENELCISFSYYISITFQNQEIKKYATQNPGFFDSISELNNIVVKNKNQNCHP